MPHGMNPLPVLEPQRLHYPQHYAPIREHGVVGLKESAFRAPWKLRNFLELSTRDRQPAPVLHKHQTLRNRLRRFGALFQAVSQSSG